MIEGELFNLIGSVVESVHGEKRLRVETKETPVQAQHVGCLRCRVCFGEEYQRYRLMIKFGFQGRQEEKVLGKVLEKREEEKMAFGIEIQSWVLGRRVEKQRERGFRVGFVGIGFAFHDFGKKFGLLIIIFYNLINFFNLINADVKNCGSLKSFSYIYIYIYID